MTKKEKALKNMLEELKKPATFPKTCRECGYYDCFPESGVCPNCNYKKESE